ncbi:lactonase family protein [Streptomyces sporangiiformans]|uniref:Lactonase family protein n=1 Tax=Streptomyces sporangiiformans TaxID=2315329 RepID=A0A505D4P1_9ACTN|nr:lactonase family protein [Streptomyces sporangiiformans]
MGGARLEIVSVLIVQVGSTPGGPDPDTIGVFTIERHGGLKPVGWVSTQGIRPRFFGLEPSGPRLFAANEVTDTIDGYDIEADGRQLRPLGILAEPGSPTSIVWRAAHCPTAGARRTNSQLVDDNPAIRRQYRVWCQTGYRSPSNAGTGQPVDQLVDPATDFVTPKGFLYRDYVRPMPEGERSSPTGPLPRASIAAFFVGGTAGSRLDSVVVHHAGGLNCLTVLGAALPLTALVY